MLYAGAVIVEAAVVWLLAAGASGWIVALTAVLGFGAVLAIDAGLDRARRDTG